MKKIILLAFFFVFLSSITLAYHGTSGNYEWRFFNDGFGANASAGNYDIRANAGGYPADTFSVAGFTGNYQEYDLDQQVNILTILLVNPPNGSSQTATNVNFIYNLNTTNNANCSLFVNGANVYNDTNKTTGQHSITQVLAIGAYNWSITCNSSTNDNISDTFYFSITSAPAPGANLGGPGGGGSAANAGPFYSIFLGPFNVMERTTVTVNPKVDGEIVVSFEKNGKWFYVTNLDVNKGLAYFTPDVPGRYRFDFRYLNRLAASVEAVASLGAMTERPFAFHFSPSDVWAEPSAEAVSNIDLEAKAEEKPVAVVSEIKEKIDPAAVLLALAILFALIFLGVLISLLRKSIKKHHKKRKQEPVKKIEKQKEKAIPAKNIQSDLDRIDKELKMLKRKYKPITRVVKSASMQGGKHGSTRSS